MKDSLNSFNAYPSSQGRNKRSLSAMVSNNNDEPSAGTPIFLRKTYEMINTCDPAIASWSDKGTTFSIKDVETFEREVIPNFFKHSRFSSFVRQLNFYGFKKIKNDPLRIKDAEVSEESKYWKFRHSNFCRGRADLLSTIRKSKHNDSADKHDVDQLKKEVKSLKSKLTNVTGEVEQLKSLVGQLLNSQPAPLPLSKRRKVSPLSPVHSSTSANATFDTSVPARSPIGKRSSSVRSFDSRILESLLTLDQEDSTLDFLDADVVPSSTSCKETPMVEPGLIKELQEALGMLPPKLQSLFVERIVAAMADPIALQKQVDDLTTLANAAAQGATAIAGTTSQDQTVTPLAAAVFEAYLNRESNSTHMVEEITSAAPELFMAQKRLDPLMFLGEDQEQHSTESNDPIAATTLQS